MFPEAKTMATETELKLSLDPEALRRVGRLSVVRRHAQDHGSRVHLTNTYYDTPDQRLAAMGMALRIRRAENRWIQTVKTVGETCAGMHNRNEWEWEVSENALNLECCDAEPEVAEAFTDPALRAALQPLFTTDFWRTTWELVFPDGSHIELVADHGEVSADGRSTPICELELEIKDGSLQRLYEVAHALAEVLPLHLENTSKSARGYALLEPPSPPVPHKAGAFELQPGETTEAAFQAIIQHCLEHLHTNSAVVTHGEDPEGIHQMRVATRRLRSCLGLFRPLIPRTASDGVAAEIRWLSGELGLARDWDVFIDETLNALIRYFPDHAALNTLLTATATARAQAYQTAQAAVHSPRYTRLLLGIGVWYTRRDWRDPMGAERIRDLERPVEWFAANLLARRHTRVYKWGRDFLRLSNEGRHRLRILCKRLRYAGDFFAELYPDSGVRDYLRSVAELQDVLGSLNDSVVARRLLTELATAPDDPAAHLVLGWKAAMTEQHLTHFESAWATFCDQPRFWE
ncbi:triphosphatase [Gammaproteobacteria bacterium]